MSRHDPRPSFKQVCEQHGITLQALIAATDETLDLFEVVDFSETSTGRAVVIDACLEALSRLTGVSYTRENIGDIQFTLASARPAVYVLPEKPSLFELVSYYRLSLRQLSQGTGVSPMALYQMYSGRPARRADIEAVLRAISVAVDVSYEVNTLSVVMEREVLLEVAETPKEAEATEPAREPSS